MIADTEPAARPVVAQLKMPHLRPGQTNSSRRAPGSPAVYFLAALVLTFGVSLALYFGAGPNAATPSLAEINTPAIAAEASPPVAGAF